jgi:dihydroneopterin aldolase
VRRAVVKLGGSTAHAAELDIWIAALAGSGLPLVVVPGGGPFADKVREAQKVIGFSDRAAHVMAILAMDQFGQIILDRNSGYAPARSLAGIEEILAGGKKPVWLPSALATAAPDIEASWDISSDSLAAWLAAKLGAEALLLIKQSSDFRHGDTIESLIARGIVDPCLGRMLPPGVALHLAGPRDAASAAKMLSEGWLPGARIAAAPVRKAG